MTIYYTHKYNELNCESHELLEVAIGDYLGDMKKASEFVASLKRGRSKDFDGKPYIEGFEKFSISHSGGTWAVLIDERECGLDIQYERSCDYVLIARRFFHEEDAAIVGGEYSNGGESEAKARSEFFRIWAKREAFVKAIGSSVVYDGFPPMALHQSAEYEGKRYYVDNIEMPDANGLHAAICLDASKEIDEKLIYKEMYVRA